MAYQHTAILECHQAALAKSGAMLVSLHEVYFFLDVGLAVVSS
jgi:hypothetical protein